MANRIAAPEYPIAVAEILYRTFQPGDEEPFRRMNEAWIRADFVLEPSDQEVLADPMHCILQPGGQICIAEEDGQVIGCCALVVIGDGEVELAKMTVHASHRGRGVGRRLLEFAIEQARQMRACRIYLESNTRLASALRLYEQLGFRHLPGPLHGTRNQRTNVVMELLLLA